LACGHLFLTFIIFNYYDKRELEKQLTSLLLKSVATVILWDSFKKNKKINSLKSFTVQSHLPLEYPVDLDKVKRKVNSGKGRIRLNGGNFRNMFVFYVQQLKNVSNIKDNERNL
jgi:hypothetical protein